METPTTTAPSPFDLAVEAIVNGDSATLSNLLTQHPDLIRMRSPREHHSTLLHYISANGVEDVHQKTPPNILEIATVLLNAGADINAESDAYGGHSTALNLTATSCHPENAGVQIPLLELLLEHGAVIDPPGATCTVTGCLRNGRRAAAEFLAAHGAQLDFEAAAGLGRLDLIQALFDTATNEQKSRGIAWACEYGRQEAVAWLLEKGVDPAAGIHWAAFTGRTEIIAMLLARGAPLNIEDSTYHATPLGWAKHGLRDNPALYRKIAPLLGGNENPDAPAH